MRNIGNIGNYGFRVATALAILHSGDVGMDVGWHLHKRSQNQAPAIPVRPPRNQINEGSWIAKEVMDMVPPFPNKFLTTTIRHILSPLLPMNFK